MAVAGKAAITLEGTWSSTKDYDRLTGVAYNNNLYISRKKPPIGKAPSEGEYWMLCIEGVNEQALDAVAARVQALENNYFPKTGGQIEGNVKVRNADNGYGQFLKNNSSTDDYGTFVQDVAKNGDFLKLILIANQKKVLVDINGTQKGLLDDAQILKDMTTIYSNTLENKLAGATALKELGYIVKNSDMFISDYDLNSINWKTSGYCSGCANIPNGASNGYIEVIPQGYDGKSLVLQRYTNYNNSKVYTRQLLDGTNWTEWSEQDVKPFGSYIGNGSASSRTIETGGKGRLLLVYKEGSDVAALVTPQGALVKNIGEADGTQAQSAYYVNGKFYIATTSAYFNQSGATYYYEAI